MKRLWNALSRLWTIYRVGDLLLAAWEYIRDIIDGL